MIITNIETVPGRTIEKELGLVQGSTVRGKHIGKDIGAWLKGIVGGEIKGYSELLMEGRDQALQRMEADAKSKGADAVVNVRITTASVTGGAAELMAYGTAVQLAPVENQAANPQSSHSSKSTLPSSSASGSTSATVSKPATSENA